MSAYVAVQGWARAAFLARLKLQTGWHFLPLLFRSSSEGRRLSPRRFVQFTRRLLLFISKLDHNKFVRCGPRTRLDLYVPDFPSRAFYHGCKKFLQFDDLPPCVTVLISVTSACRFACEHCYQRLDRGRDVPLETLLPVVRRLQDNGVAFFNVEGGEPFLVYERLKAVCSALDARSEVWVNSTGDGITPERLRELQDHHLRAVMFSLHSSDPAQLQQFMRSPKAWDVLTKGVEACHAVGVPVAFNTCLGREGFYNGEFERIMDRARDFGACLLQLIQPKPAGAWLNAPPEPFTAADFQRVEELVKHYNHSPTCRDYPAVAAQVLEEDAARFGCTAGGVDRFYINAAGEVQPCEFLNVSFGNILKEDFGAIYQRMRKTFATPGENWLCEKCSPQLRELKSPSLPVAPEHLPRLLIPEHQGKPTDFYARIQALK